LLKFNVREYPHILHSKIGGGDNDDGGGDDGGCGCNVLGESNTEQVPVQ